MKMSFLFILANAISLSLAVPGMAEEYNAISRLQPVIALQANQTDINGARLPDTNSATENNMNQSAPSTTKLYGGRFTAMSDQDIFSLALGASFRFSDWLGVGATYALPINEEEISIEEKKYSIEAMVTMQF